MGKDDDQGGPASSNEEVDRRQASLLLSGLVLTPDSSLEAFRKRRAADDQLDLELLRQARDILEQISLAITSSEEARWRRVERAWQVLCSQKTDDNGAVPEAEREPGPALGAAAAALPGGAAAPPGTGERRAPVPPITPHAGAKRAAPPIVRAPASTTGDDVSPWAASGMDRAPEGGESAARGAPADIPPPAVSPPPAIPPPRAPPAPRSPQPAAGGSKPAAAAAGIDVEALNRIKLDETKPLTLSVEEPASPESPLPFRKAEAKAPPPVADEVQAKVKAPLGETVAVGALSPLAQPLPFHQGKGDELPGQERASGGATAEPLPAEDEDAPTLKPGPDHDEASAAVGGTAGSPGTAASPAAAMGQTGALLEPDGPPPDPPGHLRAMTVEQYAGLCAECAVHPSWADRIHALPGAVPSRAHRPRYPLARPPGRRRPAHPALPLALRPLRAVGQAAEGVKAHDLTATG